MGALNPLNIFLRQEVDRMQRIISVLRTSLTDLKLAIDGSIIMSEVRLLIQPIAHSKTAVLSCKYILFYSFKSSKTTYLYLTPRTSAMPWTIFLMPVCQTCGGKSPGSHPHWAFGSLSF